MGEWRAKRRGAAEWEALIGRWERGGLSQAGFCEREGVELSTFRYWRWRLRREGGEAPLPVGGRLVAVRVREEPAVPSASAMSGLRLTLPSGLGIEVGRGFDEATLRRLLAALGTCG